MTQFTMLRLLHSRGTMPITQLAWELVMDRTMLTRNLSAKEHATHAFYRRGNAWSATAVGMDNGQGLHT